MAATELLREPFTTAEPVRVLVVDDHVLLGHGLAMELRIAGFVVAVVSDPVASSVLGAVDDFNPAVVLLDLFLGPLIGTSVPLITPLVDAGVEVVMLTGVTNEVLLAACIEAGASGVLPKSSDLDDVVDTVRRAASHERVQPVSERAQLLDRLRTDRRDRAARLAPFERLTRRERVVLGMLMDGKSASEIANEAVVSLATVRSQIRAVLQKLDVTSQLAAVALAYHAAWSPDARAASTPDLDIAAVGAA